MTQTYQRERKIAIEAVRHAAHVCRNVQASITPDVLEKKDRSPVTIADFGAQAVICRALEQTFPDDPVIGEEDSSELTESGNGGFLERIQQELSQVNLAASGAEICHWIDRGSTSEFSNRFWTLDPIDGTKGFLRGGQYAIALALIVEGQIDVAVLGCPNLPQSDSETPGVILYAVRGQGAWEIPMEGTGTPKSIRVSPTAEFPNARFCESVESGHSSHGLSSQVAGRLEITREPYRLDSQCKYGVVARGEAEIYMRLPAKVGYTEKIWDHAAGVLVVEEAGGHVTDVMGRPLEFTHGRQLEANRGVIATNQILHDGVLETLKQAVASQ